MLHQSTEPASFPRPCARSGCASPTLPVSPPPVSEPRPLGLGHHLSSSCPSFPRLFSRTLAVPGPSTGYLTLLFTCRSPAVAPPDPPKPLVAPFKERNKAGTDAEGWTDSPGRRGQAGSAQVKCWGAHGEQGRYRNLCNYIAQNTNKNALIFHQPNTAPWRPSMSRLKK